MPEVTRGSRVMRQAVVPVRDGVTSSRTGAAGKERKRMDGIDFPHPSDVGGCGGGELRGARFPSSATGTPHHRMTEGYEAIMPRLVINVDMLWTCPVDML